MKTRILKTDVWASDEFHALTSEAKILFVFLLTSPEIGLIEVYRISERSILFLTGLSREQFNNAKDQLTMNGLVDFCEDWVCIRTEIGYVASNYRGAKNEVAKNREIDSVPVKIQKEFGLEINEYGLGNTTSYKRGSAGYKHRMIAESVLGRPLRSDEIVHHKDHDKGNNALSNLCILYASDHNDLHSGKVRLSDIPYVINLDTLSNGNDTTINLNNKSKSIEEELSLWKKLWKMWKQRNSFLKR
jgi:hypothetical protein